MKCWSGFLGISSVAIVLLSAMTAPVSAKEISSVPSPAAAVAALKMGNARFVSGQLLHPHQSVERRGEIASAQHPAAIVLSCSDSRVPPEILFDQGLGDLFVVRVAGNTLDEVNVGSIEYAAEHLGAPLVIVLGHKRCGAVTAAAKGGEVPGHVKSVVDAIAPAVAEAEKQKRGGDVVEEASHLNVRRVVKALQESEPVLSGRVKRRQLTVVGAYYDLDSGRVEWMK